MPGLTAVHWSLKPGSLGIHRVHCTFIQCTHCPSGRPRVCPCRHPVMHHRRPRRNIPSCRGPDRPRRQQGGGRRQVNNGERSSGLQFTTFAAYYNSSRKLLSARGRGTYAAIFTATRVTHKRKDRPSWWA